MPGLNGLTMRHIILLAYSFPDMYKIKYGVASIHQSKTRGFQEPGYKDEPIVISLDNVSIQKCTVLGTRAYQTLTLKVPRKNASENVVC